jgi:hypothetical protein
MSKVTVLTLMTLPKELELLDKGVLCEINSYLDEYKHPCMDSVHVVLKELFTCVFKKYDGWRVHRIYKKHIQHLHKAKKYKIGDTMVCRWGRYIEVRNAIHTSLEPNRMKMYKLKLFCQCASKCETCNG